MTTQDSDHIAIGQVLARFCAGLDRRDGALIAAAFWDDAYVSHAAFEGSPATFTPWILHVLSGERVTAHGLGQSLVEIDGDTAQVETRFNAHHVRDRDGGAQLAVNIGRYVDRFERRGGQWRIARRQIVVDISHAQPLPTSHS